MRTRSCVRSLISNIIRVGEMKNIMLIEFSDIEAIKGLLEAIESNIDEKGFINSQYIASELEEVKRIVSDLK